MKPCLIDLIDFVTCILFKIFWLIGKQFHDLITYWVKFLKQEVPCSEMVADVPNWIFEYWSRPQWTSCHPNIIMSSNHLIDSILKISLSSSNHNHHHHHHHLDENYGISMALEIAYNFWRWKIMSRMFWIHIEILKQYWNIQAIFYSWRISESCTCLPILLLWKKILFRMGLFCLVLYN